MNWLRYNVTIRLVGMAIVLFLLLCFAAKGLTKFVGEEEMCRFTCLPHLAVVNGPEGCVCDLTKEVSVLH